MRRRHAAAGSELDLCGPEQELLAHADFVGTVGDHAAVEFLHAGQRTADNARNFKRLAEIAVAAGDGDHRARGIDAGADDDAHGSLRRLLPP
jgi:hypothetical protein